MAKRIRLVLVLLLTAVLLSGCGYWVLEDAPVQVGSAQLQMES